MDLSISSKRRKSLPESHPNLRSREDSSSKSKQKLIKRLNEEKMVDPPEKAEKKERRSSMIVITEDKSNFGLLKKMESSTSKCRSEHKGGNPYQDQGSCTKKNSFTTGGKIYL
jgi:hypothetical protein